jgi:hypothetical protein
MSDEDPGDTDKAGGSGRPANQTFCSTDPHLPEPTAVAHAIGLSSGVQRLTDAHDGPARTARNRNAQMLLELESDVSQQQHHA